VPELKKGGLHGASEGSNSTSIPKIKTFGKREGETRGRGELVGKEALPSGLGTIRKKHRKIVINICSPLLSVSFLEHARGKKLVGSVWRRDRKRSTARDENQRRGLRGGTRHHGLFWAVGWPSQGETDDYG